MVNFLNDFSTYFYILIFLLFFADKWDSVSKM